MSVLPRRHHSFMAKLLRYFNVSRVRVTHNPSEKSDIAVKLGTPDGIPEVMLGKKWRENDRRNPDLARDQLTHELGHVAGLVHSAPMRRSGYYAYDRRRDQLSRRIHADIERGTRHFKPERFGISPAALRPTGANR